jgi:hypothetical protein
MLWKHYHISVFSRLWSLAFYLLVSFQYLDGMAIIAAGTIVPSATEARGSRYACRSASGIVPFSLLSSLDFYLLVTLLNIPLQW